jgi:hypothetical protein
MIHKILDYLLAGGALNKFNAKELFDEDELHAIIPKIKNEMLIPVEDSWVQVEHEGELKKVKKYWVDAHEILAYFHNREHQIEEQKERVRITQTDWHIQRASNSLNWLCLNHSEGVSIDPVKKSIQDFKEAKEA